MRFTTARKLHLKRNPYTSPMVKRYNDPKDPVRGCYFLKENLIAVNTKKIFSMYPNPRREIIGTFVHEIVHLIQTYVSPDIYNDDYLSEKQAYEIQNLVMRILGC